MQLEESQLISKVQAESIYSHAITDEQLADLNACLNRFEINTHPRIRYFLSQTAHESGGLKFMTEIWGPTAEQQQYDPPHAKAKELGNIAVGDGFKYRGAGVIQLTGRNNYQAFAIFIHDSTNFTNFTRKLTASQPFLPQFPQRAEHSDHPALLHIQIINQEVTTTS